MESIIGRWEGQYKRGVYKIYMEVYYFIINKKN